MKLSDHSNLILTSTMVMGYGGGRSRSALLSVRYTYETKTVSSPLVAKN